jgi:hypothetical protein
MSEAAINTQIMRLVNVRKKLKEGDYITLREEDDVSLILGIPKFKDKRDMAGRIDDFFIWLGEILKKKNCFLKV